jgi:hypothetical protein
MARISSLKSLQISQCLLNSLIAQTLASDLVYGYDQEGYYGNLSEEEIAKLDQQRSEFFKATETIRQKLNEKELALRSELAKEDPDTSEASRLQSEISKLQSKLDQKHLAYEIQVRKTVPNNNRNYRGYGPMKGYGSRGGGYCRW